MPVVQLQRYEQIIQRMTARVIARAGLTDLNDSSAVKHILAACAREIDDTNFQLTRIQDLFSIDRASDEDLDQRAKDIQPADLEREEAQRSIGYLVFSRATNTGTTTTIPIGTAAKTNDGTQFTTTEQGLITNTSVERISGHGVGRDSNLIAAQATNAGESGNVAIGAVNAFVAKPVGVDAVTNPSSFVLGRDKESDDDFRARLKLYVSSLARSTVDALKYAALGVTDVSSGKDVRYAHVYEDPIERGNVTIYIDDGAGTAESYTTLSTPETVIASALGGEEFLSLDYKPVNLKLTVTISSSTRGTLTSGTDFYLNPTSGVIYFTPALTLGEAITASYSYYTGLIAAVQKVIDGDVNDRENYPGYRAAGTLVRVATPVVVQQTVTGVLSILDGYDRDDVITDADSAVTAYINGLGISGDVIRHKLIEAIMAVDGVYDVSLTYPTANVTIQDHEIPRISASDIDLV